MPVSSDLGSSRLKQLFDFIVRFKTEHDGQSPTVRECMTELGTGSTSYVSYCLDKLERKGLIRFRESKARAIEVVGGRWSYRP
jgi:SOS-response transcriptional repressor LexA